MMLETDLAKREIICSIIRHISKNPKQYKILKQIGIPEDILTDLYLFQIPPFKKFIYKEHYDLIENQNKYHKLPYGFADFYLAYLAAENGFGIVSYDHHLLTQITFFLDYDCYWPVDVSQLPGDAIILLDTNIFIHLLKKTPLQYGEIMEMFGNNPSITFLISNHILEELYSVYNKLFRRCNKKMQKEKTEPFNIENESTLVRFIDNFDKFESRKKRKKRQIKEKEDKLRNSSHGDISSPNFVCKRYKRLYKSLHS